MASTTTNRQQYLRLPCNATPCFLRWGNVAKYKLIKEFSDLIYRECIFDLQQSTEVSLKCILCNGSEMKDFKSWPYTPQNFNNFSGLYLCTKNKKLHVTINIVGIFKSLHCVVYVKYIGRRLSALLYTNDESTKEFSKVPKLLLVREARTHRAERLIV